MNKKYTLSSIFTLILANPAYAAINCATPPSCASLGYTKTAAQCRNAYSIKCPFDNTKYFCVAGSNNGCLPNYGYITHLDRCERFSSNILYCSKYPGEDLISYSEVSLTCEDEYGYEECQKNNVIPVYTKDSRDSYISCYPAECASSTLCKDSFGDLLLSPAPLFNEKQATMLAENIKDFAKDLNIDNMDETECLHRFAVTHTDEDDFAVYWS